MYKAASTFTESTFAFPGGGLSITIGTWPAGHMSMCDWPSVCLRYKFMWREKVSAVFITVRLRNHWEMYVWKNCIFHA